MILSEKGGKTTQSPEGEDVASAGRFFEMQFFLVPQGKFLADARKSPAEVKKTNLKKSFSLEKEGWVVATSFFGSTFFGNEKKVETSFKTTLWIILFN